MAKLTLAAMAAALENKSQELLDKIDEMKKDLNLSENTVRTQTHLKSHEAHNLLIMLQLVRNMMDGGDTETDLPEVVAKWFESTTMLTEVRKKGAIILHDGDNVFDIMEQHPNLTMSKIKDLINKQGFMLDRGIVRK